MSMDKCGYRQCTAHAQGECHGDIAQIWHMCIKLVTRCRTQEQTHLADDIGHVLVIYHVT